MSSTIRFKFKSAKDFEVVNFNGMGLRLFDLKRMVVEKRQMNKGLDFELQVINAISSEAYGDDNAMVAKNTDVIVKRMPASRGCGILTKMRTQDSGQSLPGAPSPLGINTDHRLPDTILVPSRIAPSTELAAENKNPVAKDVSEDEQKRNERLADQSAADDEVEALRRITDLAQQTRDRQGSNKWQSPLNIRAGIQAQSFGGSPTTLAVPPKVQLPLGPPPTSYVCHSCGQGGHYREHCPNRDAEEKPKVKVVDHIKGIPKTLLKPVDDDVSGFVVQGSTSWGGHARLQHKPQTHLFHAANETGGGLSSLESLLSKAEIPVHLQCKLCSHLMEDATIIGCCGKSACAKCLTEQLQLQVGKCPLCKKEDPDNISPDKLTPNRDLRGSIDEFKKQLIKEQREESEKSRQTDKPISHPDMESKKRPRNQKSGDAILHLGEGDAAEDEFGADPYSPERIGDESNELKAQEQSSSTSPHKNETAMENTAEITSSKPNEDIPSQKQDSSSHTESPAPEKLQPPIPAPPIPITIRPPGMHPRPLVRPPFPGPRPDFVHPPFAPPPPWERFPPPGFPPFAPPPWMGGGERGTGFFPGMPFDPLRGPPPFVNDVGRPPFPQYEEQIIPKHVFEDMKRNKIAEKQANAKSSEGEKARSSRSRSASPNNSRDFVPSRRSPASEDESSRSKKTDKEQEDNRFEQVEAERLNMPVLPEQEKEDSAVNQRPHKRHRTSSDSHTSRHLKRPLDWTQDPPMQPRTERTVEYTVTPVPGPSKLSRSPHTDPGRSARQDMKRNRDSEEQMHRDMQDHRQRSRSPRQEFRESPLSRAHEREGAFVREGPEKRNREREFIPMRDGPHPQDGPHHLPDRHGSRSPLPDRFGHPNINMVHRDESHFNSLRGRPQRGRGLRRDRQGMHDRNEMREGNTSPRNTSRFQQNTPRNNRHQMQDIPNDLHPLHGNPMREGPPRDGPVRDGPFRDGPFRDGPIREGPVRDGPLQHMRDSPPRTRDMPFRRDLPFEEREAHRIRPQERPGHLRDSPPPLPARDRSRDRPRVWADECPLPRDGGPPMQRGRAPPIGRTSIPGSGDRIPLRDDCPQMPRERDNGPLIQERRLVRVEQSPIRRGSPLRPRERPPNEEELRSQEMRMRRQPSREDVRRKESPPRVLQDRERPQFRGSGNAPGVRDGPERDRKFSPIREDAYPREMPARKESRDDGRFWDERPRSPSNERPVHRPVSPRTSRSRPDEYNMRENNPSPPYREVSIRERIKVSEVAPRSEPRGSEKRPRAREPLLENDDPDRFDVHDFLVKEEGWDHKPKNRDELRQDQVRGRMSPKNIGRSANEIMFDRSHKDVPSDREMSPDWRSPSRERSLPRERSVSRDRKMDSHQTNKQSKEKNEAEEKATPENEMEDGEEGEIDETKLSIQLSKKAAAQIDFVPTGWENLSGPPLNPGYGSPIDPDSNPLYSMIPERIEQERYSSNVPVYKYVENDQEDHPNEQPPPHFHPGRMVDRSPPARRNMRARAAPPRERGPLSRSPIRRSVGNVPRSGGRGVVRGGVSRPQQATGNRFTPPSRVSLKRKPPNEPAFHPIGNNFNNTSFRNGRNLQRGRGPPKRQVGIHSPQPRNRPSNQSSSTRNRASANQNHQNKKQKRPYKQFDKNAVLSHGLSSCR